MEEHERIELRSDDVQEIIGTPPRWIVRYGTTIVTFAVAALVSMSFVIAYPDKVKGRVTISSQTAAVRIKVPQSGNIQEITIANNAMVAKNDLLLIMQDAANYEDVELLDSEIKPLQNSSRIELLGYQPDPDENYILGDLQQGYSRFLAALRDFQLTEEIGAGEQSVQQLQNKMKITNDGIKIEEKKLRTAGQLWKLKKDEYDRSKPLLGENISKSELDQMLGEVLEKQKTYQDIETTINNKALELSALKSQIVDIQNSSSKSNDEKYVALRTSINDLVSAINQWKKDHLIYAPRDGKISIIQNWSEQEFVQTGTEIMTLLPKDSNDNYFIQLLIPIKGSGKVDKGQKVLLKFDNFPYREYGFVVGKVEGIAEIPSGENEEKRLNVKISLNNGLITNSNKPLPFSQEMQGAGEIITEDKKVITRIFENVIKPLRND